MRGNSQNGQRVRRQTSAQDLRQSLRYHFATRYCHKTCDAIAKDGNIGDTDVMTELVLPRIALKETVQIDIPAMEPRPVIPRL